MIDRHDQTLREARADGRAVPQEDVDLAVARTLARTEVAPLRPAAGPGGRGGGAYGSRARVGLLAGEELHHELGDRLVLLLLLRRRDRAAVVLCRVDELRLARVLHDATAVVVQNMKNDATVARLATVSHGKDRVIADKRARKRAREDEDEVGAEGELGTGG